MNIRECELPGIGKKFEMTTKEQDKIAVVVHNDGRREMYHFDSKNDEECDFSITLNDEEARQLSAILGGIIYKPREIEKVEVAFDELVFEWYKVDSGASIIDKSIGELNIRQNYGVSIIAIIRQNHEKLLNPRADIIVRKGDTLVISGERNDIQTIITKLLS
ncbi:cation:proton antiporter regulatory subunit [Heyndrickxia sp. NPDC080065]|uniref:cation:proton antiporter regulatory subunit n=1 Tax=Heyndrickxia sp. NPDC080065 TaxID=3390568 RepID=UPI003D064B04